MMKTKTNNSNVDDIVYDGLIKLLQYSSDINSTITFNDVIDKSDLYLKLSVCSDEKIMMETITEYMMMFYLHISFFQNKENFEACDVLHKAMRKELIFIERVYSKNIDCLDEKIKTADATLREYYL